MQKEKLISVNELCRNHQIEISFISSLQQNGLIEITTIENDRFIEVGQLQQIEKCIRLHFELEINLEGIETITHLLERLRLMQDEIVKLRNKLSLYETEL